MINFHVSESLEHVAQEIENSITVEFPDLNWERVIIVRDAEVAFVASESEAGPQNKYILVPAKEAERAGAKLAAAMLKGDILLPTEQGRKTLMAQVEQETVQFSKLKRNNPAPLDSSGLPPKESITGTLEMAAFAIHPTAMSRYVPAVKKVFDRRAIRSLQRKVDSYQPLVCGVLDEGIKSMYPPEIKSGRELNERIEPFRQKLSDLGVTPAPSDMSFSQINLGIPFPGGANRAISGLTAPSSTYDKCAAHVAKIMLRGVAVAYEEMGDAAFRDFAVRVGVKKANYQGVPLSTTSHSVRQTAWSVMEHSEKGIWHFADYNFPTGSGFRRQANSGKKRVSFALSETPYFVHRATVMDGEDMRGQQIYHYGNLSSVKDYELVVDGGEVGARCRVIENIWSFQNDSLLPIPALIGEFKDKHYKYLFQQDPAIMNRFVPGTIEFAEFWTDAWNSESWVRTRARELGLSSADELIDKMIELSEYIIAGDVENFDGYTTWELVFPFFRVLISVKAIEVLEKLWNADKIGVYTDASGRIQYYYISCVEEDWMDEDMKALVRKTLDMMSHVASGLAVTAQCGRGVVPTVMMEIALNAFEDVPHFREIMFKFPSPGSDHSPLNMMMNSAGDDHNISSLFLWFVTGIHPKTCRDRFLEAMAEYTTLKITREVPAMNAGYFFHEDEEERLIAISLSEARMWANGINPEYPRSAVGLWHSVNQYINSAIGTPSERNMVEIAKIMVEGVYGFESLEYLEAIAKLEEVYMQEHADEFTPVERIAALLGIPTNKLEWDISFDDLIEMGVPTELVNEYRRPMPENLTRNPFNFLNEETILSLHKEIFSQTITQ